MAGMLSSHNGQHFKGVLNKNLTRESQLLLLISVVLDATTKFTLGIAFWNFGKVQLFISLKNAEEEQGRNYFSVHFKLRWP